MISTKELTPAERVERAFSGLGFTDDLLLAHVKQRLVFEMDDAVRHARSGHISAEVALREKNEAVRRVHEIVDKQKVVIRAQKAHEDRLVRELEALRERSIKPGPKFRTVVNGDYVYVYADRPGGSELAGVAHKGDHYWHAYGYKRNACHNAVILGTWPQRTVATAAIRHFAEYEGYLKE